MTNCIKPNDFKPNGIKPCEHLPSEVSEARGLVDWINFSLCNGWVHIKCANLSRTQPRSLVKFKCSRCSLVNTIPQCQDDNFKPDTLFNSGFVHLKRVPKNSRIPLAENLIPKITDICETPSNIALWCGAGTFRHQLFGRQKFLPISATIMSPKCSVKYVHIPLVP